MRLWIGVEPKILCRQHLLGEWREHFTFLGSLKKKISMKGYIKNNLFEPLSLKSRHEELKKEMKNRGYNFKEEFDFSIKLLDYLGEDKYHKIDKEKVLKDLITRCPECKKRYLLNQKINSILTRFRTNNLNFINDIQKLQNRGIIQ